MIDYKKAKYEYSCQKSRAKKRSIEWKLTFEEWITWWISTGNYDLRGCNKGQYCMSRIGDSGAYEITNIFCNTIEQNTRDAHAGKKTEDDTKNKIASALKNHEVSQETRTKISNSLLGRKRPKHVTEKIIASRAGKKYCHKIIECPHCGKTGGTPNMKRYHLDNCKQKINDTLEEAEAHFGIVSNG